ncbi:MAG: cytochrome c biogenesis protein CcsA [Burkholderiaceae bacterium]|nr:cytochrome c biogenesis protein CcsA [Burkholderiaceae bacterium]
MILPGSPLFFASSIAAAAGYLVVALGHQRLGQRLAQLLFAATWALHGLALVAYWWCYPNHFGFAVAISITAWLVSTIYGIETQLQPKLRARWVLAGFGAAAVGLAVVFPGSVHPAASSVWLPIHWALGLASYGLIAVAVFHAWLVKRTELAIRHAEAHEDHIPLLGLERLMFQFVGAGFVLLTATLIVGLGFTDMLYGVRFRWDHKTIFSVLSWLTLAVLLIGRWRLGWRGKTAARTLYVGAGLLLMGYVGSRFVLEVLLARAA